MLGIMTAYLFDHFGKSFTARAHVVVWAAGSQLLQLQRYTRGFKVGFNVVGSPEGFLATGGSNSTAFVFGRPHDRLPFADATFDTVLSMNILEHVQDLQVMYDSGTVQCLFTTRNDVGHS